MVCFSSTIALLSVLYGYLSAGSLDRRLFGGLADVDCFSSLLHFYVFYVTMWFAFLIPSLFYVPMCFAFVLDLPLYAFLYVLCVYVVCILYTNSTPAVRKFNTIVLPAVKKLRPFFSPELFLCIEIHRYTDVHFFINADKVLRLSNPFKTHNLYFHFSHAVE